MIESHSRRIAAGPGALNVVDWGGSGAPVLLLHGLGGNTHWWDRAAVFLKGQRLLALDFRGHGDSSWSADGTGYRIDGHAADVERVRESLGWDKFILAGHSLGGRVALSYAAAHPRRLLGVAALDFLCEVPQRAGHRYFERGRARRQPFYATAEEMETRFRLQPPGTVLSPEALRALGRQSLRREPDGRWTWKFDWRAFAIRLDPVWPALPKVAVPALAVRGALSTVMPAEHLGRVVAGLPGCRGHEVPHAHHHVPLDAPRETARILSEFFAAVSGAQTRA